jgi:adenine-specific DNA-methyltransferase
LEYILGIVNSSLISWYGKLVLPNFGKDIFPKLNPADIKELPIPANFKYLEEITNKVFGVMVDRHSANHLESEIDQLIYQLYGLTEEEIKIVEGV